METTSEISSGGASVSRDGEILFRQEHDGDFSYRKLLMLRSKTLFRKAFFGETWFQGVCGEGEDGCIGYLREQRGVQNGGLMSRENDEMFRFRLEKRSRKEYNSRVER